MIALLQIEDIMVEQDVYLFEDANDMERRSLEMFRPNESVHCTEALDEDFYEQP